MGIFTICLQIALVIPILFIKQLICVKKEDEFIFDIFLSNVYIFILAIFFPFLKSNIYLIVIFEIFFKYAFLNNDIEGSKRYLIKDILNVLVSVFIYNYYIIGLSSLLPKAEDTLGFLWFLIIVYSIKLLSNKVDFVSSESSINISSEYIISKYASLKVKYYKLGKSKENLINDLVYSILVFEEYTSNNGINKVKRIINKFFDFLFRRNNVNSLLYVKNMFKDFEKKSKTTKETKDIITVLLKDNYNEDEIKTIKYIYNEICMFNNL